MAERLPLTLRAYALLMAAATPLASLLLRRRLRRGKEHPRRLIERRGETTATRPRGSLVWVHGASVGELAAAIPLVGRLRERKLNVLVTTGTVTSAALAAKRLPPGAIHQFAPLDAPAFIARFLGHWRPDLALFVESDLWPNTIMAAAERRIPLILVNGRLSARSFERWRYLPGTIETLLKRMDLCLVRTTADAERFDALGAPRITTTGNLKLDVPPLPVDEDKLARLSAMLAGRPVFAAASTHLGEETAIIDTQRRLKTSFRGLLTILVPRHPERGPSIADAVSAGGLTAALRSRGQLPQAGTDIYIADTLGELGLFYRLAPIVFMGGSLIPHGGQNPIEPAQFGAAILHGPHVANFADIYAALDRARGAELVPDAARLPVRVGAWLTDAQARARASAAAKATVDLLGGALERTVAAIEPYLMQLRLERRDA
ncbi:MAG TPA: 3-deoxy-D-manno-octulosonic acid transferase [Xanthobacteraceae bacterium]|nr:3-deoxy-D-manno-octulosonic acid transferase [Xanthobacteraceae bacterium]